MPLANDPQHDGDDMMQEFAAAASDLDLRLEDAALLVGQPIGALISCDAGEPIVHVKPPKHPPKPPSDDLVHQIVVDWETFDPDDILATWDRYAIQPHTMVLTNEWIGAVERKMLEEGIQTESYRKRREEYPSYSPRRVTIENLRIVYTGAAQAVATYRFEEHFKNGKVLAANSLLILMMNRHGEWKIGMYSKHI